MNNESLDKAIVSRRFARAGVRLESHCEIMWMVFIQLLFEMNYTCTGVLYVIEIYRAQPLERSGETGG